MTRPSGAQSSLAPVNLSSITAISHGPCAGPLLGCRPNGLLLLFLQLTFLLATCQQAWNVSQARVCPVICISRRAMNIHAQRILHISMYVYELYVMCAIDSVTRGEGECVWGLHSRVGMIMEKRFQSFFLRVRIDWLHSIIVDPGRAQWMHTELSTVW